MRARFGAPFHEQGRFRVVNQVEQIMPGCQQVVRKVGALLRIRPGAEGSGIHDKGVFADEGGQAVVAGLLRRAGRARDGEGLRLQVSEHVAHGFRRSAVAEDEGFGQGAWDEIQQGLPETGNVGIETLQFAPAGNPDAVDGAHRPGFLADTIYIRYDILLVGDGDIEAPQFGMRLQQGGKRFDAFQLEGKVFRIDARLAETFVEIPGRTAVPQRITDDAVKGVHAQKVYGLFIFRATLSMPYMRANPRRHITTACQTSGSLPVSAWKWAGEMFASTRGRNTPCESA